MKKIDYKLVGKDGKDAGTVALNAGVFGVDFHESSVHKVVRWQLAKRRAGTHATLNRKKMTGGGRKPWRQKGTGRARAGSANSPLWVGGAVAHGPQPRDYSFSINGKTKRLALKSALSSKVRDNTLLIVKDLGVDEIKTKEVESMLRGIGAAGEKSLIVTANKDEKLYKSSRNIPGVDLLPVAGVNVYDLLWHKFLIVSEDAVEGLEKRFLATDGE